MDCQALVAFAKEGATADDATTKCALDPPSAKAVLRCLLPAFRTYHTDARAFYLAEKRVAKLAAARGFSKKCVAVIGDAPKTIAAESRLATDLEDMVDALKAGDLNKLQAASNRVGKDADEVNPGQSSLSVCPHQ